MPLLKRKDVRARQGPHPGTPLLSLLPLLEAITRAVCFLQGVATFEEVRGYDAAYRVAQRGRENDVVVMKERSVEHLSVESPGLV